MKCVSGFTRLNNDTISFSSFNISGRTILGSDIYIYIYIYIYNYSNSVLQVFKNCYIGNKITNV